MNTHTLHSQQQQSNKTCYRCTPISSLVRSFLYYHVWLKINSTLMPIIYEVSRNCYISHSCYIMPTPSDSSVITWLKAQTWLRIPQWCKKTNTVLKVCINGITTSILLTLVYFQYHKTSFSWKILYKYFCMFYVLDVHQYGYHTN
jgi:hypothetical protein